MKQSFENQLKLYLQADYPLIFIVTHEEQRAANIAKQVCDQLGRRFLQPRKRGHTISLADALGAAGQTGDVVWLDDVHRRLEEPAVLRLLGDLAIDQEGARGCAIVVAPFIRPPEELLSIGAFIELPLPDRVQLGEVLDQVCGECGVLLVEADRAAMCQVAGGLTLNEAHRAFKRSLIGWPDDAVAARGAVEVEKRKAVRRSAVLEMVDTDIQMADVGGLEQLKRWLKSRQSAFSDEARAFGLPAPRGLLLMGVQGCGKSLCAKAVASVWRLPEIRLDLSAVFGQPHPEESLRFALSIVGAMAPAVLWIDEIEKGFGQDLEGAGTRLLGGLITWLQEKNEDVFVVATANRVESLPPELPRKGRFDEIFFVDLPAQEERRQILELHLRKRHIDSSAFGLDELVSRTDKFTGSELEQLVISAMYLAFEKREPVGASHLNRALINTVSLYETFEKDIKTLREWARTRARNASTDRKKIDYFKH